MPATAKGFRYPSSTDTPDVPRDVGYLAADVNDLAGLHASGRVSTAAPGAIPGGSVGVVVTFPVGRFPSAPVVTVACESSSVAPSFGMPSSITAAGFTLVRYQLAGAAVARDVGWHAHL